ncbi:quinic acid utilization qutg inositol-1or 4-monophosphatase, partial [Trichoderma arundinaceum]
MAPSVNSSTSTTHNLTSKDLQTLRNRLISIAKQAGTIILAVKPTALTISTKKNAADIVTETDKAVESFVRESLAAHYPSFAFIGEETYDPGLSLTNEPTFIVDPIDGTSNFVHGFPDVAVSIALVVDKQPTVGVVYCPFRDDLWVAIKGQGAYALQGNGLNTEDNINFDLNLDVFATLLRTTSTGGRFVNSLRCTGPAAIAICRVAAGQQDAFW